MLTFINSSKTMVYEDVVMDTNLTEPRFVKQANDLAEQIVSMGYEKMQELMGISDKLAQLNFHRYVSMVSALQHPEERDSIKLPQRAAIFAYRGDVYDGLDARRLDEEDLRFGQEHIRIVSGLYGILRPLDQIKPYRMEMAYKMPVKNCGSLAEYWQKTVESILLEELEKKGNVLVNLASKEYSVILEPVKKKVRWIDIKFLDFSKGKYRFITLYGKRARGMMAAFIMKEKLDDISGLKEFNDGGYRFSKSDSSEDLFVFKR